ncbi:MAG: MFS transporter [Polyangiaceae bacterium]
MSGPAAPRPAPLGWSAWLLAGAATLTMAVSYFDRQTLASLAPKVTADLGISNEQYGWLVSAFSVAYLVGSPLSGRFVDRFGGRRVLLGAVLVWTIVAALHARASGFVMLLALRVALGFAESPSFPGAVQTVHRALPLESRARGVGLLFTGSSIGALIAPLATSAIEHRAGWRYAFLVTAFAGLVWVPMWLLVTSRPSARAALDVDVQDASQPTAPKTPFLEVLKNPAVLRAAIVVLASAPMVGFVLNWSAKYLTAVEGIAQADMGRYLWVPPLLFDIGSVAFGHFASIHVSRHRKLPSHLFILAACLASTLPLLLVVHGPYARMAVAGVAIGGVAGLFAMFTSDMISRVPRGAVSAAGGITAAAQSLVYIIANPIVGKVVDSTHSYSGPIVGLALPVIPGVLVFLAWRLPKPSLEL